MTEQRSQPSIGHDTPEGYAASLRQQSTWVDESREARVSVYERITLDDIDTDEMRAAAEFIEVQAARIEALEGALRIFVAKDEVMEGILWGKEPNNAELKITVPLGKYREARFILNPTGGK